MITQSEKELDEVVKETEFFCSMVIKGLMSVLNEETTIPSEVLGNLENFKELSGDELPSDLPHMRDKCKKVKVFNMEDDVMVFLHKEMFSVGTYSKLQPSKYDSFKVTRRKSIIIGFHGYMNNFNIVDIHEYQADETLYQEENSGSSSSEVVETDAERLF